jgi:phospholipase C
MTELTNRIDHVVIIVKENHTFDNYLGPFPSRTESSLGVRKTHLLVTLIISTRHGNSGQRDEI